MLFSAKQSMQKADETVRLCGSRDPRRIADFLGISVIDCSFKKQKGVYKVIERNRFIFIKSDLDPVMRSIVLLHEIGHDILHRSQAISTGGFQEFNIFDMRDRRMEYEANMFAAQVSLPDDEILEYIKDGCDVGQIAAAMDSDINLVALKVSEMNSRGFGFIPQEHRSDFLR